MIRAVQYDFIRQTTQDTSDKQHKIHSWGLGSWDPAAKEHMMAYDKQVKDFTTMYDEETIL